MKYVAFLGALVLAAPALAQPAFSQPGPASPAPVDPARLALARSAAEHVWPNGTYAKIMDGVMGSMMDNMMSSMFDMPVSDIVPEGAEAKMDPETRRGTMREMIAKEDPHFEERMRITNRVMAEEMVPIMTKAEPQVREGLARAYARKFTAQQLSDLNQFFATPTGRAFAPESIMMFMDPELMSTISAMAPDLMRAMPGIMAKVQAATAHLPLPKKPEAKEPARRRKGR